MYPKTWVAKNHLSSTSYNWNQSVYGGQATLTYKVNVACDKELVYNNQKKARNHPSNTAGDNDPQTPYLLRLWYDDSTLESIENRLIDPQVVLPQSSKKWFTSFSLGSIEYRGQSFSWLKKLNALEQYLLGIHNGTQLLDAHRWSSVNSTNWTTYKRIETLFDLIFRCFQILLNFI